MRIFYLLFLLIPLFYLAQGPKNIATVDRQLWTKPMQSSTDFDTASKMEMLAFISVLSEIETQNREQIYNSLSIKDPNEKSVDYWISLSKNRLVENVKNLNINSLKEIISVKEPIQFSHLKEASQKLNTEIPKELKPWLTESKKFYTTYILECIRLAAKNPKRTSEIELLNSSEKNGFEQADKSFLLTFDDGPTLANGNTDDVIKMLAEEQLFGLFFLSGDHLQLRLQRDGKAKLSNLYTSNGIGSHSMLHQSHQYQKNWKSKVDECYNLIQSTFDLKNNVFYFRPPYGQRTLEMTQYLGNKKHPVLLWNIDSQDWNNNINANQVASRTITLMLLWRKGILLFHDVHPKAKTAVPVIKKYFEKTGIIWIKQQELK